jgi:hypothetical protein
MADKSWPSPSGTSWACRNHENMESRRRGNSQPCRPTPLRVPALGTPYAAESLGPVEPSGARSRVRRMRSVEPGHPCSAHWLCRYSLRGYT